MCHVPSVNALDSMDNMVLNNTHRNRQADTDGQTEKKTDSHIQTDKQTLFLPAETTMSICSAQGHAAYLFAPSPGSMPLQSAQLHIRCPLFV